MEPNLPQLIEQAYANGQRLVEGVKPAQHEQATCCDDWNVHELLNHMVGGATMFGHVARSGAMPNMPSGTRTDFVGTDPAASFAKAATECCAAWREREDMDAVVRMPFGELPARDAARISLLEATIHAWDLAQATGQPHGISDDLAEATLAVARGFVSDQAREAGAFKPVVDVPADAPAADRLAGFLGRQP